MIGPFYRYTSMIHRKIVLTYLINNILFALMKCSSGEVLGFFT